MGGGAGAWGFWLDDKVPSLNGGRTRVGAIPRQCERDAVMFRGEALELAEESEGVFLRDGGLRRRLTRQKGERGADEDEGGDLHEENNNRTPIDPKLPWRW